MNGIDKILGKIVSLIFCVIVAFAVISYLGLGGWLLKLLWGIITFVAIVVFIGIIVALIIILFMRSRE